MTTMQEPDIKLNKSNPSYLPAGQPNAPRLIGVKISIFLVFILAAGSLAASGYLYQMLNVERRERVALEAAKVQLEDKVSALQEESNQYKDSAAKIQEQLKAYTEDRDQYKKQLEAAQTENGELKEKVKSLEESSNALAANSPVAIGAVAGAQPTVADLANQLPGTQAASASANTGSAQPDLSASAPAAPAFQVMTVNRKFNFVVINVGSKDQIKMGDKLNVEHSQKAIATIQVEKVYDRFSAAAILEESKESPIKEGDPIRKI